MTENTPGRYKILDAYMSFVVMMGVIQFVYCFIIGKEPWATFLAGFISCVGTFVLVGKYKLLIKNIYMYIYSNYNMIIINS